MTSMGGQKGLLLSLPTDVLLLSLSKLFLYFSLAVFRAAPKLTDQLNTWKKLLLIVKYDPNVQLYNM